MAAIAQSTAPISCFSNATATKLPMPGSFQVVSPTEIASEATTKNQPPDMDSIVFHTSPGMAKGTSSFQKRCQDVSLKPRAASVRSGGTVDSDW